MCGILFYNKIDKEESIVINNFEKLKHRGPDASNYIIKGPIFMGCHRLSITNLNENGIQPFEKDSVFLICNGQIYNYKELATEYNIPIEHLRSDIDIILYLYFILEPTVLLNKLDGDFAFVLYDSINKKTLVGRDCIGVRPLFIGYSKQIPIAYSSEIKGMNDIVDSIQVFPPQCYSINGEIYSYMNLQNMKNKEKDEDNEEIVSLLKTAVVKRIDESDRPVAFLCSGGLDSSIILSIANEYLQKQTSPNKIHIFSIEFIDEKQGISYDAFYAKKLGKILNVEHTVVSFNINDIEKHLPEIIYHLETYDPNTIRASIPMFILAKYIKENTDYKVILSGEGVDELFCGYSYFEKTDNTEYIELESKRLVNNLHMFDVLRADRCFNSQGLEIRVPFLDKKVVEWALSLSGSIKKIINGVEKKVLRDAFSFYPELVETDIIGRQKEKMSDGCGFSYIPSLLNWIMNQSNQENDGTPINLSKKENIERLFYREMFDKCYDYIKNEHLIVKREMPEWCETKKDALTMGDWSKYENVSSSSSDNKYLDYNQLMNNILEENQLSQSSSGFLSIIEHLLLVQNKSMLDITKCSETSRNIFNYLSKTQKINHYDNLSNITDNYDDISKFLENKESIIYVHFQHITGENSHYFIIYKKDEKIYLLQSAVFEFSFHDWIYPEKYKMNIINDFTNKTKEIILSNYTEEYRLTSLMSFEINNLQQQLRYVNQIENCLFSRGTNFTLNEFKSYFLDKLNMIRGNWNIENIDGKISTYRELFSCSLNKSIILNEITQNKDNCANIKCII